jgi:hypothetical protein
MKLGTIIRGVKPVNVNSLRKRFVVYYDGGPSSLAALRAAIDAMDTATEIIAVAFIPEERTAGRQTTSSDMLVRAESALAAAETNAAMHGLRIKTQMISGVDIVRALRGYAKECGADEIFFGTELETRPGMALAA